MDYKELNIKQGDEFVFSDDFGKALSKILYEFSCLPFCESAIYKAWSDIRHLYDSYPEHIKAFPITFKYANGDFVVFTEQDYLIYRSDEN